jgi:hypothetical protein
LPTVLPAGPLSQRVVERELGTQFNRIGACMSCSFQPPESGLFQRYRQTIHTFDTAPCFCAHLTACRRFSVVKSQALVCKAVTQLELRRWKLRIYHPVIDGFG